MKQLFILTALLLAPLLGIAGPVLAENAARPIAEPVLEPATLHCLGIYWRVAGDDNQNTRIEVHYKKTGTSSWRRGPDLFRIEKGAGKMAVPAEVALFAGSIVMLEPDTGYDVKLNLTDQDGGATQTILRAPTMAEPQAPKNMRVLHVVPGTGGGTGTTTDPFKGLGVAQALAKPGDLFLVHAGVYAGTFEVGKNGEPGRPIIWRGAGDGEAVIDGQGHERVVAASDTHDVWFERLTIQNAKWGLVAHAAPRMVVRRCHIHHVLSGITATRNTGARLGGLFIADNTLEGSHSWSEPLHGAAVEEHRGIEISGTGNVVCYNRVRGFKDGIDMYPTVPCVASDVHNNEVSECLDDGCEMDGAERNCRCYLNRYTNIFQGISVQPVYGGPIYIFRNALYNLEGETFKMHNSPSGAIFYHNTSVKRGVPLILSTQETVHNCVLRNNLFLGSGEGKYAYEASPPMQNCDFDFDGFSGGPWKMFLKWNNVRYASLAEVKAKAPVEKHAVLVEPTGNLQLPRDVARQHALVDLRLPAGSAAIDAGAVLSGFNDGFAGQAPDLGAYEFGTELPHYGPRPDR